MSAISEEDDETLNLRIQCQEPEAIGRLLELYGPKAKGYLRKQYGFCDADIDTVLFQAVARAWQYGASYEPKQSLKSWFMRIVQTRALSLISEKKERQEVGFSLDNHDRPEECDDPIDKNTKRRIEALDRCIQKLERNQQTIIREDLKSDDVAGAARLAKMLGSSTNSIYVSRIKARANLKKCVENESRQSSRGEKP